MARLFNFLPASGNLNTLVAGSVVTGNSLNVGDSTRPKVKMLSALVSATAATATLTVAGKWQVSNDNSTWIDVCNGSQNAASVVLTTGTAAIVTKSYDAPQSVYAWPWCRFALVTGVATGAAGDLYSIAYNARSTVTLDG